MGLTFSMKNCVIFVLNKNISYEKRDNQISNLSTIVPNFTSSNTNILELETLVTKKSISPYKNIKLPSLVSKNALPRIAENSKGSAKSK
jgi:hypothetical protein